MSTQNDRTTRLARCRLFKGLDSAEINDILERGTILHIPKGDTICSEGEAGSYVFIILMGSISIYRKGKMIAKCKDYDAFGEMSVLNGRPRSATAKANTIVELLALDEMEVNKILGSGVAVRFLLNIVQMLSERLEVGNTWIATSMESMRRRRSTDFDDSDSGSGSANPAM